jgi:hypothetical protein
MVLELEQGVLRTSYKILVRKHRRSTERRRCEVYAVESGTCLVASFGNIGV